MGQGIAEKILGAHLASGRREPGATVEIRIDQTLTQDATGTLACLQFEALGVERVGTELSVSYVDHNTLQEGFENADDHAYLKSVAARYGMVFSRPGNGICHQVHLERFGAPGKTLLGSDSHTPTCGGIGMLAIGAGGLDVALAMAGRPFALSWPRVIRVHLTGALSPWVAAKDVILDLLSLLATQGNVGALLEYAGPGVKTLSVPQRATIANMGAELGVTTSVFPSDEATRAFLAAQGREEVFRPLQADADAVYARTIEVDLSRLEPLLAAPHSPDNVLPVARVAGMPVDQVCIGSCTNSSYRDLVTVARILKGKAIAPNVSLVVAPGSRQVLEMIARDGALADLIASGARLAESACGFCIGSGQAPQTEGVSVRTSNRNFLGRSGTASAKVYLASPETAAACALAGEMTDPRSLGVAYPAVEEPREVPRNDSLLVFPPKDGRDVPIVRGPGIGRPPPARPLPDALRGVAALKVGDKITTDHIMPAGPRLKHRSNVERYAEFVFEGIDPGFAARARKNRDEGRANLVVAGESYGQGSSREHAAICPMILGVRAVLAKSIERIHAANLVNFGVLPLVFARPEDYDALEAGDAFEITSLHAQVKAGGAIRLVNRTKERAVECRALLSDRDRAVVLAGGRLAFERGPGRSGG
ncbi:MAG: aconitate hydratase [Planctomycetota bacterium]